MPRKRLPVPRGGSSQPVGKKPPATLSLHQLRHFLSLRSGNPPVFSAFFRDSFRYDQSGYSPKRDGFSF